MMTFTLPPTPSRPQAAEPAPRHDGPLRSVSRVLGSALAWFSLTVSIILFAWEGISVAAIGGSCATGGAYEIAVQCPEDSAWRIAAAVILMFVALIGLALSSGFGTSLAGFGWFLLFGGFGSLFIAGGVTGVMSSGWLVGTVFVVMGVVPLAFLLWASPRGLFIGNRRATGERYYPNRTEYERLLVASPKVALTLVASRLSDWALALVVSVGSIGIGVAVSLALIGG